MAEEKERYVIAKGVSFVGNKKHYVEGDEIDKSAFEKPEQFEKLITAGKIVKALPKPKEGGGEKKGGKKDKAGGEMAREALEKAAIDSGLLSKEQLTSMKDDEIEKALKFAGVLG